MAGNQKGLGRGLESLIKDRTIRDDNSHKDNNTSYEVFTSEVIPSPWQPRTSFDSEALLELVNSVKTHGIMQPLIVRKVGEKFELIAGERRLRAAQEVSLEKVPVRIINASDQKALELALIENLQREDLNIIEQAKGYRLLQEKFNLTQDQISEQVGKARASIANILRLLDLSEDIQSDISAGLLTIGHAKVLLSISSEIEQSNLAQIVVKQNLTVRDLEQLVKKIGKPPKKKRAEKNDIPSDYLKSLTDNLHQFLGTQINIRPSKTLSNGKKVKGSLEIIYHNNEELDRILDIIGYGEN